MIDRRKFPRFTTTMTASIFDDSDQPVTIEVQVQNMSAGGALLYSPVELQKDQKFTLLTPGGEVWNVTVIDCEPAQDARYVVRCAFGTNLLLEAVDLSTLLEAFPIPPK